MPELPELLHRFGLALALGLLTGLERESAPGARAGLRTFSLTSLFGCLTAMLAGLTGSSLLLPAGLLAVLAFIVAAHLHLGHDEDPGTTTVVALLLSYGIGALVWLDQATLATMLTVLMALLLHLKPELRGIHTHISRQDMASILQFGVLSLVILPVLPNTGYGPYDALNPHQIWWMVVLISGLGLAGYLALNIVGQRWGTPLIGIMGGLASSTATTLVFAREVRAGKMEVASGTVVILLANLVVNLRLAIVVGAVSMPTLLALAPFLAGSVLAGGAVVALSWRHFRPSGSGHASPMPEVRNPVELRVALGFGLLFAGVLLLAAWLDELAGQAGLYLAALVTGITDVDAITLSSLRLVELGRLDSERAVVAIAIGFSANLLFKLVLAASIGGRRLATACGLGMLAMAVGGAVPLYITLTTALP